MFPPQVGPPPDCHVRCWLPRGVFDFYAGDRERRAVLQATAPALTHPPLRFQSPLEELPAILLHSCPVFASRQASAPGSAPRPLAPPHLRQS